MSFEDHVLPGFASTEHGLRGSQSALKLYCERVHAAKHAPRNPFRVRERLQSLAEIVERRGVVLRRRSSRTLTPRSTISVRPCRRSRRRNRSLGACSEILTRPYSRLSSACECREPRSAPAKRRGAPN